MLLEKGWTYIAIASKVYCSEVLVRKIAKEYKMAAQLNLYFNYEEVACSIEKTSNDPDMRKIIFREKLKSVANNNPELSRNQIRQRCSNEYIWLQKNDSEWLEQNLPPSKLSLSFNWNAIDESLAARVKVVAHQLLKNNPKTRVAEYTIMHALTKIETGRTKNNLKDLPKTAKALRDCAETKEQYQVRYLPVIVQQLREYYGYNEVSIEVIQSYRRSYREISDELKQKLCNDLLSL